MSTEPTITDEMVEAALDAFDGKRSRKWRDDTDRVAMRAALLAAQIHHSAREEALARALEEAIEVLTAMKCDTWADRARSALAARGGASEPIDRIGCHKCGATWEEDCTCGASDLHASDCAVHNEPALPKGECDCGASEPTTDAIELKRIDEALEQVLGNLERFETRVDAVREVCGMAAASEPPSREEVAGLLRDRKPFVSANELAIEILALFGRKP